MTSLAICEQTSHILLERWAQIRHGGFSLLHLNTRPGGGSHQLIRLFQNEIALECITWHARFLPEERNRHILPKILNGLWKNVRQSQNKTTQILKSLHQKLSDCATKEDQQQLQSLIDSLRASRLSEGDQVIMSDNRPIRALITLAQVITETFPVLIVLEDIQNSHAMTTYAWLDAMLEKMPIAVRLMVIVTTQSESQNLQALPQGFAHIHKKHSFENLQPQPWNQSDLENLNLSIPAQNMLWWTEGLPGRVLELKDQENPDFYATSALSFSSAQEEEVLCAAALFGIHFPTRLIAMACNKTVEETQQIIQNSSFLAPQESSPVNGEEHWGFKTATAQLKVKKHARTKENTSDVLELYFRGEGVRDVSLLTRLLDDYTLRSDASSCANIHKTLHSAESDLSWLHLADTCISHQLEWPPDILSTALLAGLRHLYEEDLERAKRMFVWCLQWAAKNNQSRTAMEAIRTHAKHFDRLEDQNTAFVALQDAIQIAQETKDTLYLTGLHLDLAEHHLFNNQEREAQVALQLIRSAPMPPAHGMRFLSLLGRIDVRAQRYHNAQEQFQKARDIALEEGFLRNATDLALLRIQALIEAEDIKKATNLHQEIRNECAPFAQRESLWQNLKKEIIAKS